MVQLPDTCLSSQCNALSCYFVITKGKVSEAQIMPASNIACICTCDVFRLGMAYSRLNGPGLHPHKAGEDQLRKSNGQVLSAQMLPLVNCSEQLRQLRDSTVKACCSRILSS